MDALLKKHFWVINLLVIGICAMFAGRALAHFVEGGYLAGDETRSSMLPRRPPPQAAVKVHTKDPVEIVHRDVFCSGCAPVKPAESGGDHSADANNTDVKSTLQLELVSTMVCPSDERWSMAVIRDLSTKEKDPAMFNRGAKVATTEAVVYRVLGRRVYLRNQGHLEYLELEGSPQPTAIANNMPPPPAGPAMNADGDIDKGVTCNGNNCNVDRKLVESLLSNTAVLASAARFVPSIKDGKPNGFKLYAIRPNSIFGKIGLQNGDTIRAINGLEMTTPDKALEVYTKLRYASHLSVSIERRGENSTLDYSIR